MKNVWRDYLRIVEGPFFYSSPLLSSGLHLVAKLHTNDTYTSVYVYYEECPSMFLPISIQCPSNFSSYFRPIPLDFSSYFHPMPLNVSSYFSVLVNLPNYPITSSIMLEDLELGHFVCLFVSLESLGNKEK